MKNAIKGQTERLGLG